MLSLKNGEFDEKTQSAVGQFISDCRHTKLIEYFTEDPYNTVVAADTIMSSPAMGPATALLHQLFKYYRKDMQRIIWRKGAEYYLKPRNCNLAAQMLLNSLNKNPTDIKWNDDSEVAKRIKNLLKFQSRVKAELFTHPLYSRIYAPFSGKIKLILQGSDDLDLYYSFGKIDINYDAFYDREKGWVFKCKGEDFYDFGFDTTIPYQEIFTKGVQMVTENKGKFANNAGWFSQNSYTTYISFVYCYKKEGPDALLG